MGIVKMRNKFGTFEARDLQYDAGKHYESSLLNIACWVNVNVVHVQAGAPTV